MWFNLFMLGITGAIAWFQTLQGAYSALIMMILTALMTTVTFEFYELAAPTFLFNWYPDYSYGMAFLAVFAGGMIALRYLYDLFAPANMYFPTIIDRSIAGACGIVTALMITGVISIGMQMFPLGPAILGYDRIGIVGEPGEGVQETDRTDQKRTVTKTFAMDFSVEDARAITRSMWLSQDEFAFGVYRMLLGGFRGRELPKDHFRREVGADEFLARCWDWRVQNRFQLTPVGLRVPPWEVYRIDTGVEPPIASPILLREVWKMTGRSYGGPQGDEHPIYKHLFAVVEIPRGAGVPDWYWRPYESGGVYRGGFPPLDHRVVEALKWQDPAKPEFTSFAYWQVKLVCVDQDTKREEELPVRGVWPLDVRRGLDASGNPVRAGAKPVKYDLVPEVAQQIRGCRLDNIPSGNLALLRAPPDPDEPWYFRIMFYGKDTLFKEKVYIRFTRVPRDTRDLAEPDKRAQLVSKTATVSVRDLDNQLLQIEPPPLHEWWKRVRRPVASAEPR
jgi:hypothetical protein